MKLGIVGLTLFSFLVVTTTVQAKPVTQTALCVSNSDGDWSVIDRWSCGHVPTASDEVVINHAVAIDTNATILSLTTSGTLTFDNNSTANHTLTVLGDVTINSGGAIIVSPHGPQRTHSLLIGGNLSNAGILDGFSSRGNRVLNTTFNGAGTQTISGNGTTNFNDLIVESGTRAIFPAANLPTVEGTLLVNNGGAVQQTLLVASGSVPFLQISDTANIVRYRGVELTPTISALGSTTVVITTTTSGGCTTSGNPPNYAARCYSITPTNNVSATIKLWALTATQLNGIPQASLRIYHYLDGVWQQLANSTNGTDGSTYSYAQGTATGFSAFLLGDTRPTAVTLTTLHVQSQPTANPLPIGIGLVLGAIFILLLKHRTR